MSFNIYNPYYNSTNQSMSPDAVEAKGRTADTILGMMPKVYKWASIEEFFAEFLKPVPKGRQPIGGPAMRLVKGTMRKIRLGWADEEMKSQLKRFHDLYQFIKATVNSKLPKVEYRPKLVGSRANIAGIVVGDPRTAIGRKPAVDADKRRSKSNLVRLCCNVDAFADVGGEMFFVRGAAMCALAEALEAAKYRVEITLAIASIPLQTPKLVQKTSNKTNYISWSTEYGYEGTGGIAKGDTTKLEWARDNNQRYFVTLKPFNVPVAPLQVAFAMMHPSVLRVLFFKWWHHYLGTESGEQQRFYRESAGSVGNVPEGYDGTFDVYVAGFDAHNPASSYSTKEGAVKWILDTLKDFGITTSK